MTIIIADFFFPLDSQASTEHTLGSQALLYQSSVERMYSDHKQLSFVAHFPLKFHLYIYLRTYKQSKPPVVVSVSHVAITHPIPHLRFVIFSHEKNLAPKHHKRFQC